VMRVAGAAFGFLIMLAMVPASCAGHANRRATAGRATDPDDGDDARPSRRRIPHTCRGAQLAIILPPRNNLTPVDLVRTPELGPEPPPPEPVRERSELLTAVAYAKWRMHAAAVSAAHAIEDGVPGLSCGVGYDGNRFTLRIFCGSPKDKDCELTTEVAQQRAEQIRAVVTPTVEIGVGDCACRIY